MIDARVARTRAALHQAAIELAAHRSATEITVSDLAAAAGINRATFYKHYDSPGAVLAAVLSEDLGDARSVSLQHLATGEEDPVPALRDSLMRTLDHVERYIDVYLSSITQPQDGVVLNLLIDYFAEATRCYLQERAKYEPAIPEIDEAAIASFMAHGITGALKNWLLSEDRDREKVVSSLIACRPAWWYPYGHAEA